MSYFTRIPPSVKTTLVTLTWFPVIYTFANHLYQPCQISGISMAPTLNPGTENKTKDIALVQKFNLKKPNSLSRGDVIMFRSPQDPEKLVTKRVVGLQGDTIMTKSPPYPKPQTKVPRNHVWVEGDNAFHSIDSNNFGPVSQALVVGKVVGIMWPISRISGSIAEGGRDARQLDGRSIQVKLLDSIK